METQQLTEDTQTRVFNFKDGCNKDGCPITTMAQLQLAYAAVSEVLHRELDINRANEFLKVEILPVFKAMARKMVVEA